MSFQKDTVSIAHSATAKLGMFALFLPMAVLYSFYMIFGHLPLGYVVSQRPIRHEAKNSGSIPTRYRVAILCFFSLFPDIDLFFTYFFNASESHRNFITHTPIFYLMIWAILAFIAKKTKKKNLRAIADLAIAGVFLGHLLPDSLNAGILWLWPLSDRLFGLRSFFPNGLSFAGMSGQTLVFWIEVMISAAAILIVIQKYIRTERLRIVFFGIVLFATAQTSGWLLWSQPFRYPVRMPFLTDADHDGTEDTKDSDIDGDEVPNEFDDDRDGDGKENYSELADALPTLANIWLDPSGGKLLNVPRGAGLVIPSDLATYALSDSGFFLQNEIARDALDNRGMYRERSGLDPIEDKTFWTSTEPQKVFFEKHKYAVPFHPIYTEQSFQVGDIVYFSEGASGWSALVAEDKNTSEPLLIVCHPSLKQTRLLSWSEVQELPNSNVTMLVRVYR